jgi:restriction system protein
MDCDGPQCAALLLDWIKARIVGGPAEVAGAVEGPGPRAAATKQEILWKSAPYQDDAPAIFTEAELDGALEHLRYAVFRRYENQLTRAERARLDNTIQNALYKIERYAGRLETADERARVLAEYEQLRDEVREGREKGERLRMQAKRADLKISQLGSLSPEGFEEFVAEVFESLGYAVERVGGSGDEGADLRIGRDGLRAVVQCKYYSRGVIGSPELQKFLGTVHHTRSHKGFFVTTRTFTLAAEKFAAEHPIELIDGPRLVELVQDAMGPGSRKEPEPVWF